MERLSPCISTTDNSSNDLRSPTNGTSACMPGRLRVDGKFLARDQQRLRIQGVTYGPFAPNPAGEPFPSPPRVAADFSLMQAIGINSIRTYLVPPEWFLRLANEWQMAVFVDVAWPKHICFLESRQVRSEIRNVIREAAIRGRNHPGVLAYSVGNEIPPGIVRWFGARRVERFLAELGDVTKQADPQGLVTYANYPPTEYLDLSFLDFATFNVYLHDQETFRRYLVRLQNLVGDKPVLLGELGMDTLRHGQAEQAGFLVGHLREAMLMGLAGAFVFAWTDDWHTGGYPIQDWAFGITDGERLPKMSYEALGEVFGRPPAAHLPQTPRVSVVVCSYNGGRTLEQCLRSLLALDYPDFEVIVIDDGSTDDTAQILARFPGVRAIRQSNRGLSVARNVGLQAATGSVIAYTDSDCFADRDWLTHLVYQLSHSGAAAVGGPNLSPDDGWLAACVAASPGQPMHVLESDQVAEHIPGCNMAFRREALEAINGFDPQYRKAGDDVDLCWRLQQAGFWITFAAGAFVWHHRRQHPRSYLRQQAGYGEAEALLQFKHPDKFNGRGSSKWRGVLYGASLQGLRFGRPIIYQGIFGTGLFQCLYQRRPAHWAMLPSTLEWHAAMALVLLSALWWMPAWWAAAAMFGLSLGIAALQAAQAPLPAQHKGFRSRLLIAALSYLQPLVRSWHRYRTRLFASPPPLVQLVPSHGSRTHRLAFRGSQTVEYWTDEGYDRTELLGLFIARLVELRWPLTLDSGWSDWDVQVHCHPWTYVRVRTVQEDHGGGKRLMRVHYRQRLTTLGWSLGALAVVAAVAAASGPAAVPAVLAGLAGALLVGGWWRGNRRAGRVAAVLDSMAERMNLVRCGPSPGIRAETTSAGDARQPVSVPADKVHAWQSREQPGQAPAAPSQASGASQPAANVLRGEA